jgi:hypothetical protein
VTERDERGSETPETPDTPDTPDTLEALEAQVPDEWVTGMWDAVQGARARSATSPARPRRARRWVMPALAAAVVALLFANGLTFQALRRARAHETDLATQLLDQQRRLAALEESGARGPLRGNRVARSMLPGRDAWVRSLESGGELTLDDLRALLGELPAGTPIMDGAQAGSRAGARLLPGAWRQAFTELDTTGPLTAGDLLDILNRLDLPGSTSVPRARLIQLLS